MLPKVSIIILNWNGSKDTIECLESVKRIDYSNYEIIVVDNGSSDGSPELIRGQFPDIAIIENKGNLGFCEGNNIGIKYAMRNGAKYYWLLNNDTIVDRNALSELVSSGERSSDIGLLSPVIYYYSTPSKIQFCGSFLGEDGSTTHIIKDLIQAQMMKSENILLWGTALLIKRNVIESIGNLNDKFFAYYEDTDYSLRALKNGFINKVVLSAKIYHKSHFVDIGGLKNQPVYYFYYMSRNVYWTWMSHKARVKRIKFFRKYIIDILKTVGGFKENSRNEYANAVLEGAYCAIRNIGGSWEKSVKMPKMLMKFVLWHPYLWADILECNFKKIFTEFFRRVA